tara:strand:- start:138 stop:278 length:141 start_codon:yes stop_codon:yes gene_type:complete
VSRSWLVPVVFSRSAGVPTALNLSADVPTTLSRRVTTEDAALPNAE